MKPSNFDDLTKALANSTSRRHALRTMRTIGCFLARTMFAVSTLVASPAWGAAPVSGTLQVRQLATFDPFVNGILNGGASPRDGTRRVFFTSINGQVWIVQNDVLLPQPFIDVSSLLVRNFFNPFDECGLINITFHPDFRTNGKFYLRYSGVALNPADHHDVIIAEYRVNAANPNQGDASSGVVLYRLPQTQCQHTGGSLFFGQDGKLYASFGHGSAIGDPIIHGQNPDEAYSALIRIDVDGAQPYAIPTDNPFGNEVYAYGFRNPFACNVDRQHGDIYCADVGEDQREEIDLIRAGGNYGFPILEGSACFPAGTPSCTPPVDYVAPVIEYDHTVGQSIQGGVLYRGHNINKLRGIMVVGDFGSGNPSNFIPPRFLGFDKKRNAWQRFPLQVQGAEFHDAPIIFIEDESGEIYFTTVSVLDFQAHIYKVVGANIVKKKRNR